MEPKSRWNSEQKQSIRSTGTKKCILVVLIESALQQPFNKDYNKRLLFVREYKFTELVLNMVVLACPYQVYFPDAEVSANGVYLDGIVV